MLRVEDFEGTVVAKWSFYSGGRGKSTLVTITDILTGYLPNTSHRCINLLGFRIFSKIKVL